MAAGKAVSRTGSGHEVKVVDTVQAVGETEWNAIVARSDRSSVFHRYEWTRAIESGLPYTPRHLVVEEDVTEGNLKRFHRTYERVMDRVEGEVLPLSFFERLTDLRSRVLLLTIRIEGEYAGGMVELLDDEQSTVRGFKAAVPREYFENQASELLYDHVIRWGIENGYETYGFGMSRADFADGVYTYKEGFGGHVVPSIIWERGCSPLWRLVKAGRRKYLSYQRGT